MDGVGCRRYIVQKTAYCIGLVFAHAPLLHKALEFGLGPGIHRLAGQFRAYLRWSIKEICNALHALHLSEMSEIVLPLGDQFFRLVRVYLFPGGVYLVNQLVVLLPEPVFSLDNISRPVCSHITNKVTVFIWLENHGPITSPFHITLPVFLSKLGHEAALPCLIIRCPFWQDRKKGSTSLAVFLDQFRILAALLDAQAINNIIIEIIS